MIFRKLTFVTVVAATTIACPRYRAFDELNAKPVGSPGVPGPENPATELNLRMYTQASAFVQGNFEPSLQMREAVDFLLTPAVLVQQSSSEGVLLVYPAE